MSARARTIVVVLAFAATLVAASAPYLYGWWICPSGTRFWAIPMVNYYDANQYLALTRQAAEGNWFLGDPFTGEPHAPRLFLPEVLVEGMLCRVLGVSPLGAFHLSRVGYGALLLGSAWWFGTLLVPEWRRRWLFLALLCTSAGAGWLVELCGGRFPHGDAFQPEANTFHTLGNLPHLSLSAALLTLLFATLVRISNRPGQPCREENRAGRGLWPLVLVLVGAFLLAWTHPFDLVTYAGGLTLYGLALTVGQRKFPLPALLHVTFVLLGVLPAGGYLLWLVTTDPFYRALADDPSRVQPFLFYASAHGLLLLGALLVLLDAAQRRRLLLPLCWVGFCFFFLLLPLRMGGKQPRLLGGVHVPLALLSAVGIDLFATQCAARLPGVSRGRLATAICVGYALLTATGAWGIAGRHVAWYARRERDFFLRPELQRLFARLEAESFVGSELTLGGKYTGGWAPVLSGARVYYGHWHMTLEPERKWAELEWFFTAEAPAARKVAWLRGNRIRWVIWWPWEWRERGRSPETLPGLEPIFRTSEATLLRVTP